MEKIMGKKEKLKLMEKMVRKVGKRPTKMRKRW